MPLQSSQSGFTLLLTIIVISVVLAVTLSSLSSATKQVRLSADTRDSEIAFHAANAGLECIRYHRRDSAAAFEGGDNNVLISCFGESDVREENQTDITTTTGDGSAYLYEYQISWGTGTAQRCSQMRFVLLNADIDDRGVTVTDMTNHLSGYPADEKTCEPGGRCTAFSSQGYSARCPESINGSFPLGTIQREIFVEF